MSVNAPPATPLHDASVAETWRAFIDTRSSVARDGLATYYDGLARSHAARCFALRADDSVSFQDFLQYARVGLLESIERFDLERGVPFAAYASRRIRGAILNGLPRESELAAQREAARDRTIDFVESVIGRGEEGFSTASFDELVATTVGLALAELLESGADEVADASVEGNPYAASELAQLRRVLIAGVAQLPERERQIVEQHYFLLMDFTEIAAELSVTKGRVSQLHAQAMRRLRERFGSSLGVDREL